MTPEERAQHESAVNTFMWGCAIVLVLLALLYGALTGDWEGVGRWLSN